MKSVAPRELSNENLDGMEGFRRTYCRVATCHSCNTAHQSDHNLCDKIRTNQTNPPLTQLHPSFAVSQKIHFFAFSPPTAHARTTSFSYFIGSLAFLFFGLPTICFLPKQPTQQQQLSLQTLLLIHHHGAQSLSVDPSFRLARQ